MIDAEPKATVETVELFGFKLPSHYACCLRCEWVSGRTNAYVAALWFALEHDLKAGHRAA